MKKDWNKYKICRKKSHQQGGFRCMQGTAWHARMERVDAWDNLKKAIHQTYEPILKNIADKLNQLFK